MLKTTSWKQLRQKASQISSDIEIASQMTQSEAKRDLIVMLEDQCKSLQQWFRMLLDGAAFIDK